jgi:hypothetical protein
VEREEIIPKNLSPQIFTIQIIRTDKCHNHFMTKNEKLYLKIFAFILVAVFLLSSQVKVSAISKAEIMVLSISLS